ncbi:hypothetical protein [Aneurinibacillus tyrosinisolvens]|uniref:hypothetical protein n=1 Tax=Aneurinibacillus tyrosinisolvens TaxID=1443435 RepID=UPI0013792CEC|nr:hypothetical protein [Aneurinibacillus tyrosinisolvens]
MDEYPYFVKWTEAEKTTHERPLHFHQAMVWLYINGEGRGRAVTAFIQDLGLVAH